MKDVIWMSGNSWRDNHISKYEMEELLNVDLEKEWKVEISDFVSLGKNSPLQGTKFKGKVVQTLVDGEVIYSEDKGHNG